jgi:hypothetical protein
MVWGLTLLVFFISTRHSSAQQYSLQDLGALSGDSVSKAFSLNNQAQATGPTSAIATLFNRTKGYRHEIV